MAKKRENPKAKAREQKLRARENKLVRAEIARTVEVVEKAAQPYKPPKWVRAKKASVPVDPNAFLRKSTEGNESGKRKARKR